MDEKPVSIVEARENLSAIIGRAVYGGERVILSKNGKPVAFVASIEDLRLLEAFEDHRDYLDAEKGMAEFKASGERGTPIEEVIAELTQKKTSAVGRKKVRKQKTEPVPRKATVSRKG